MWETEPVTKSVSYVEVSYLLTVQDAFVALIFQFRAKTFSVLEFFFTVADHKSLPATSEIRSSDRSHILIYYLNHYFSLKFSEDQLCISTALFVLLAEIPI